MGNDRILKPEDYLEPNCPLCEEPYGVTPQVKAVPQQRIREKLEEYMSYRDYAGVERHLLYWLEEAKLGQDLRGELMIRNEMIGHYRKTLNKEKALESIDEAIRLIYVMDYDGTISSATTYINCGTAYNCFGENEKALPLFQKAKKIYESTEKTDHRLLGGLYNNMALTCVALKDFRLADELYRNALQVMEGVPDGCLEQAITYLNMANAEEDEKGMEAGEKTIFQYLDTAYDLLVKGDAPHDGYYAFVCEKCAPTFSYYGYFMAADELNQRAVEIYERD